MTAAIVGLGLVVGLLRSHASMLKAFHDVGLGEDALAGTAAPDGARVSGMQIRPPGDAGIRTVPGVAAPSATSALGRLADIDGVDPQGGAVRVGLSGAKGTTLLAFLSTGCSTCHDFWRAFGTDEIDAVPGDDTRVVVVTRGPEEESPAAVAELAPPRVTTVMSSAAWDAYDVPVSPYFLLVDAAHGVVGEGASASWSQVVDLLAKAAADAGLPADRGSRLSRRALLSGGGREREQRADRELADAGIGPGSPDLYAPLHAVDDAEPSTR